MDNPMNVNGSTGRKATPNDTSDLYEYDDMSSKNVLASATGKVKQFISSATADPDESTDQYKRDIIDILCLQVNQTLIIPKAFYFFFFAAFGSLFPLMAIYFKQMAMTPFQVGCLFGFKPFVEFVAAPFWAYVGERWRKGKLILLISLLCWILFTLGVGFIKPPVHSCLMHNGTHIFFEKSRVDSIGPSPSKTIVSGGYKVINKRDLFAIQVVQPFYNDNENDNENDKWYQKQTNDDGYKEYNVNYDLDLFDDNKQQQNRRREKREDQIVIKDGRRYRVKHVKMTTKFTSSAAPTTTTITTTTSSSTTNSRRIDAKQEDELNFDLKSAKSHSNKSKSRVVDKAIQNVVDSTSRDVIKESENIDDDDDEDDDKNSNSKELQSGEKKKPAKTLGTSTVSGMNMMSRPAENYFDSAPLEMNRNRNKIIFLNDSALTLVKPSLETSIVYHKDDVHRIFLVFLFFILAGEFFSAPAITLADACTLNYLGPTRTDLYGRQRMFGSLGWALAMFSVGLLLDNSKAYTDHPCGKAGPGERNYTVCFAIYSVLMLCALVVASQFKFYYGDDEEIPLKAVTAIKSRVNKLRGASHEQFHRQRLENEETFDDDDEATVAYEEGEDYGHNNQMGNRATTAGGAYGDGFTEINLKGVAGSTNENRLDRYMTLLKLCRSAKHVTFLFVVWFMGIGVGLTFTFLFWHLQDLGGSPSLYGIASVINHVSELMAYFFVHQIVREFGHVKVFYAGLLGNAIRFLYVALLSEPYWILPFEFIQGVTHALVWATATSYFSQSFTEELRLTAQGSLQGLHFGLGRGCGAVLGGMFINKFGTKITFAVYGILCLMTLFAYIAINFANKEESATAKQHSTFVHSEFTNEQYASEQHDMSASQRAKEIQDSKYYYGAGNSNSSRRNDMTNEAKGAADTSSSFVPMAPHGAPSTNPNWLKQFNKK